MSIFDNIDYVVDALDDKIVHTDQGSFIRVDDLKEFHQQVREAAEAEKQKPRPKTFHEAREMAKKDPAWQTPPAAPRAPAFASVKGVTDTEESDAA